MRICQLQNTTFSILIKSFCIISLFGCAETPVKQKIKAKNDNKIVAQWFSLPPRFSSTEFNGSISIHPFYDVAPAADFSSKVRYIVTTGEASKYLYEFDLFSGKLYRERAFCEQDDIWKNYKEELTVPNFTMAILPRVFDENKKPQKIILFGNKDAIEPFKESPDRFGEAKIIGSVLMQSCEKFPCDMKEAWKTSQILVGVSTADFDNVLLPTFTTLKNKVDWDYAKAMLTNMYGYNSLGGKKSAAYRFIKELPTKDSIDYLKTHASVVTDENFGLINSDYLKCSAVYDSLWGKSQDIRKLPHGQQDAFFKYFKDFLATSSNEFYECHKRFRPANILDDTKRFWFFAYLEAFMILEKNNIFFSCANGVWSPGVKSEMERCRASNFERAFETAINGLRLMKTQTNTQYRFVEYDNLEGGSHQKIYGWLYDRPQVYACKNSVESSNSIERDVFPQDVVWENFQQDETGLVR